MRKLFLILLALFALGAQAQVRFEKTVDTVNDLQNLQPDDIHNVVFVKGYASAGAADGATFVYDSTSAAATNTVSVFKPTSVSGNGRWIRQDLMFQAGSATIPSITFGLDNNTGLANSASDQIDIITGGTRRGYVDSAGSLRLTSGVASSNTTTGTAIITGGLGLSGAFNAGGVANVTDTTEATTGGAGAIKTSGGIYSAKKIVGNTDLIVNTSLVYADSVASKVGINTTGPDAKLDVLDASGAEQIRTTYTDGSVYTKYRTLSDGSTLIQDSSGRMLNSTVVNNTAVSARARHGGLAFDGVTASAGDTHTIASIGTSDATMHATFLCPSSNPSVAGGVMLLSSSSTTYDVARSWYVYVAADGSLTVKLNGATNADTLAYALSGFVSSYGGKVVSVALVKNSTAATLTLYVNGIAQTLTTYGSGTQPTYADTVTSTYAILGKLSSALLFNSTIYSAQLFTRALSASEVVDLANRGVSEADKWANLSSIITGDSADFAGGTVGNWAAVTAGSFAVVSQALQFTNSTGGNGMQLSSISMRPKAGKRYRLSFTHKLISGSAQQFTILGSAGGSLFVALGSNVLTFTPSGTVATFTTEFTNTGDDQYLYFNRVGNDAVYEFDNFSLVEIGCLLDPDLAVGVGYQAPDRSSNHYDGLLSTTGVSHTREERRGQARFSLSADGYLGDTTSRACIPADARIESIVAYSTGTPTFTIGDDSGAAANIIGATILSASTVTDLGIPLKRFATTGTKGRIYIDFTAGAAATTFTVNYTTTGNY